MALVISAMTQTVRADHDEELARDVVSAMEILKKADSTLGDRFASAAGYAIFPSVAKGGLGIGAAHGSGEVFEKGLLIGHAKITQVTVGLQVGGQSFIEAILFENDAALQRFKDSKLEMSAQVGAVAAAEGAAKNAKYVDGVLIITKPKSGLMAEASVGGQKFKFTPLGKKN